MEHLGLLVAMVASETPAWDVKEEEMVDVLDFLAAYREDLNMVSTNLQAHFQNEPSNLRLSLAVSDENIYL